MAQKAKQRSSRQRHQRVFQKMFSLPSSDNVKLSVYNVAGQKVRELVNNRLDAGNYTVDFAADGLSSGIYLYVLQAGSFKTVRKMTLLK